MMISLAWTMTRAGGWGRPALLAGCTAVVSGLLLVTVSLLLLRDDVSGEQLASFVQDDGTRGGVAFAVVLLTVPPLLLLDQAVRLGSAARHRRMAALRVAGATPRETRLLGAIEVGIPASAGAVLGVVVYAALRVLLGADQDGVDPFRGSRFSVVPTSVAPALWQIVAVVIAVAALGTAIGWRGSAAVVTSPLGVTRRQSKRRPRPWGLGLVVVAAALTPVAFSANQNTTLFALAIVALLVAAPITLAPWLAFVRARGLSRRTEDAATLLAAQRIVADPGAAGRAAAAIGGIAVAGGGLVAFVAIYASATGVGNDPSVSAAVILVAIALLVGLAVATGSMAVHSVESLLDRRREVSFLAATGMLESELEQAARREITAIALPLAVAGSVLGAGPYTLIGTASPVLTLIAIVGAVAITASCVWAAAALAVRVVRPWARRAASPLNLRTE